MKNISRVHDLTGQKFGKLTVIGLADTSTRKTFWICECDCGNIKTARSDSLLSGAIKSCGCLKKEQDSKNLNRNGSKCKRVKQCSGKTEMHNQEKLPRELSKRHESYGKILYRTWQGMKKRCSNPNDVRYDRYGGRGISVCDEWACNFNAFYEWAIQSGFEESLSIDRIDNDGNYCPENCRWSTAKEQANNRSTNISITIGNATKTLYEWCVIFELDYKMVNARYHRGDDIGLETLFSPRQYRGKQ